ncbi:TetR/AcrR family transcriptional regulator [Aeromicrobium sp.]|uniref:TetR/AcrR family transcriptional regulator n=1 Tax=Aeromicrobium sp. TaxID=1871063 RepID=UPI003D6B600E
MSKTAEVGWREARREAARAKLLATAWDIVREDGLAALTLRQLATRAGVTTPTVYAYFDSKNAIFDAMFGEAAETFAATRADLPDSGSAFDNMVADARRWVDFCTSDVPRYQLLFQRPIPGFEPSPEAYEPAVRALDRTREYLARNGVTDARHFDTWTAVMTGLVDQQIANEPGGDRWTRLIEDVVRMLLAHTSEKPPE